MEPTISPATSPPLAPTLNPSVLRKAETILHTDLHQFENQEYNDLILSASVLYQAEGMIQQLQRRHKEELSILREKSAQMKRKRQALLDKLETTPK